MTRRLSTLCVLAAIALTLSVPPARAHPLGNFSINHLTRVAVDRETVRLHYVLDQAEIPTFQERGLAAAAVLARKRAEVAGRLEVSADGRRVPLRFMGPGRLSFPPGQGGLRLTRLELDLVARVAASRVLVHDGTFPGRVGWKALVAAPGRGTATRSSVPSGDPTHGLRSYPRDMLSSPLDERSATLRVRRGAGTLTAPRAPGGHDVTTRNRSGDGLAGVFADAAAGRGVLVFLLLAAFAWGALHALSPGHGKAMVAAYLVGTRGTARHAIALGAAVTVTHTAGVFALGLVTLALSQYVVPEQLYPWLNLASGLLVVAIGAAVLRARLRSLRALRARGTQLSRHGHEGDHDHSHAPPDAVTWKGLVAMGASAGLIPCPSALVVLLGAVAQHQVALGLAMIVVFSLGLAATLTALGLAVVYAKRATARISLHGRLVSALPAVSALIIVAAGCALTFRALPQVV